MSNTLKVTLALDNSNFKKGIDEAKKSVDGFADNSSDASAAIEKIEKKMQRQIDTAKTYSRKVASMREAIVGYTLAFNDLDEATQNSDFGKSMQARIEELTNKAAELQDAITETSNAIRLQSDGEIMYQATIDGLDILSNSMQTVIGVQGLLGGSTEKMIQAMQTMQTVQAAANTVTKMTAALQRDSAIAQAAARLATSQNTVAVIAGTAAQKAMNIAVKANPYIIAATALAALVAGVYKFITAETEAEKKHCEFNEGLKQSYIDEYTSSVSTSVGTFARLQTEWKSLKTIAEKNEWIKSNTDEFKKLGISITDINDAQNAFITNSDAVIKALTAQGKAAAASSLYSDVYKERFKTQMDLNQLDEKGLHKKAKEYGIKDNEWGVGTTTSMYSPSVGVVSDTIWDRDYEKLREIIIERENERYDKMIKSVEGEYIAALKEQENAFNDLKSAGIKTTENTVTDTATVKQTAKKVTETINKDKDIKISLPLAFEIPVTNEKTLKEKIKRLKDKLETATGQEYIDLKVRITEAENELKDFQETGGLPTLQKIEISDDMLLPIQNMRELAEKEFERIMTKADETGNAISAIGGVFTSLGGAIGGTSGEMLNFVGTIAQGAATIIPIIAQMIAAKQAEAMASGTAEGAKMPFPANLVAIATILSTVIGIFASLPKFAEGGVFKGTSLGDMNIARVNGGEMILNNRQQEHLFRLLNGEMSARYDDLKNITWKLKGADLYASYNNYSNIKRKSGML